MVEKACFIRVQMHGATVSRHQPVCEIPGLLSRFYLFTIIIIIIIIIIVIFRSRRLLKPRKQKQALYSFNGHKLSCAHTRQKTVQITR